MEISIVIFALLFCGIALALAAVDSKKIGFAFGAIATAEITLAAATMLAFPGVLPLAVAVCACLGTEFVLRMQPGRIVFAVVAAVTTVLALMLGLHFFKGFPQFEVYSNSIISSRFPHPLTIVGGFDKGFGGLIVLLVAVRWPDRSSNGEGFKGWWRVPAVVGALVVIALISKVLILDPKWPAGIVRFALSNALLTSAAEEALFRGVLYGLIRNWLPKSPLGGWLCIAATTMAFLMVHHGSIGYLLMVALVGLGCGWVRERTGHISAAFATHASINLTHFLLLSYPIP